MISRNFKLRSKKSSLAIILLVLIIYLSWLFAFPLFGPIITSYFNAIKALSIEKGKWILLFIASMIASNLIAGLIINKTNKKIPYIIGSAIIISILTFILWLNYIDIYIDAILLGLTAGIISTAWGAYFTDNTSPEERGRIAGCPGVATS